MTNRLTTKAKKKRPPATASDARKWITAARTELAGRNMDGAFYSLTAACSALSEAVETLEKQIEFGANRHRNPNL